VEGSARGGGAIRGGMVAVAEAKGSLGSDTILSITENGYGKMMKKKYERKMNLIDFECNCLLVYISGKM
jgi:hypothetical protein